MNFKVSSDHKDSLQCWKVSNFASYELARGFFWKLSLELWELKHISNHEFEGGLTQSHPLDSLPLVNNSITALTILHLEQWGLSSMLVWKVYKVTYYLLFNVFQCPAVHDSEWVPNICPSSGRRNELLCQSNLKNNLVMILVTLLIL